MERRLRNNGEAMRNEVRSAGCPSEEQSDERLERIVMPEPHRFSLLTSAKDYAPAFPPPFFFRLLDTAL
jgi:hypothetical protein